MKKVYPLILVFCATLTLNSCRENCCGVVDTNVTVVVKDQQGNNLLTTPQRVIMKLLPSSSFQ